MPTWKSIPNEHWGYAREMRKQPTVAEKKLWLAIRHERLGVKFRRQYPVGPYIADFYCRNLNMIIEVDGNSHSETEAIQYDQVRDEYFRNQGIQVKRYTNREVLDSLDLVLQDIVKDIPSTPSQPSP